MGTVYTFGLCSSLEKVFPDRAPAAMNDGAVLSALQGEVPSLQLFYTKVPGDDREIPAGNFELIVEGAPVPARLRSVELVPNDFTTYEVAYSDPNYITKDPGLFPDVLKPMNGKFKVLGGQYRAIWIDFPNLCAPAGNYRITVTAKAEPKFAFANGWSGDVENADALVFANTFTLRVLEQQLPAQSVIHTEWFHGDGIAQYYHLPVFSEGYWSIVESYIAMAGEELAINSLLTPIFTPPLDTAKDGERKTVQLIDVEIADGEYSFNFDKLQRWCEMCKRHKITYLEMAHFFTQWGAKATPKIVATEYGVPKRIFGWDVPATDPEYRKFLQALVPELRAVLRTFSYDDDHVIFHISDEPSKAHIDDYLAAKAQVIDLLEGSPVVDALSDYAFYESGAVQIPVPANDHIQPFIDAKVPNLWVYYCCGQCVDVPNRFYAMPSARNRIMGVLMYLHDNAGFLHWGYNFYNWQFSLKPINPYINTHAGYAFPAGDPFLVYPGEDGKAVSSIRGQVQRNGFDDIAALKLLESLAGREFVVQLIKSGRDEAFTYKDYPKEPEYLLNLHEQVLSEIAKRS